MSDLVFVPLATPRDVRFRSYAGTMGCTLLAAGAAFAGFGLFVTAMLLLVTTPFWEDWGIDARGVPATGVVDAVRFTNTRINNRPVYEISFHYPDADGIPHSGKCETSDTSALGVGASVPIHYVPGEFRRARVDGTRRSAMGLYALIPLVFAGIGLPLLLFGGRGILRRRRLHRFGQVALGKVVSVARTNTTINNRPLLLTRYTFPGPAGPVEGTMQWPEAPPEGSDVTVLYDAEDPSRSTLPPPGSFPA